MHSGRICLVVSDRNDAYALERARIAGIESAIVVWKDCPDAHTFEQRLHQLLEENGIDLIVLAGFMRILSPAFTSAYPRRILNIHPSLIPAFCGKGYYGLKVHEAALARGVKLTGATVQSTVMDVVTDDNNDGHWRTIQSNALVNNLTTIRLPNVYLTAEQNQRVADLYTVINDHVTAETAKFIVGTRSLDELDAYFAELKKLGIEEYIQIYREIFPQQSRGEQAGKRTVFREK